MKRNWDPGVWRRICLGGIAAVGAGVLATGCSVGNSGKPEAAVLSPRPALSLPSAEVFVLGSQLTPVNAATHAIGKPLPFGTQNEMSGETGSTQMAFARTSRGLIAYVLSEADVVPVNVATDIAGKPIKIGDVYAIAASPDGKTVYVATNVFHPPSRYSGTVTPIDTATNTAGHPIPVGASPILVAFAPDGATAYVVSSTGRVTPVNVATGRPGPPVRVGAHPGAIVFTPDSKTAYVASPPGRTPGTITPINVATGVAGRPIPVGGVALAITPDGKTLYALRGSLVTAIHTATNALGRSVSLGRAGMGYFELLMAPDGKTLYAMDDEGQLTPIDAQAGTAGLTVSARGGTDMAITPDGKTIYLTDSTQNTVTPYDTTTRTVGKPISLAGSNPNVQVAYYVAVAP